MCGGGGVTLHAREWGNAAGPPILFIHGWSQSDLCWSAQVGGPLAERFRMVTFDLRGHGASERPLDAGAYTAAQPWADDLAAVIDTTGLERPVLVGWSYGGFVIADYLRAHGEAAIGGIELVGGAVLLRPPSFDHIGPGFLENAPAACDPDLRVSIPAIRRFLGACTACAARRRRALDGARVEHGRGARGQGRADRTRPRRRRRPRHVSRCRSW